MYAATETSVAHQTKHRNLAGSQSGDPTTMLLEHRGLQHMTPEPKSNLLKGEGLSPVKPPPFAACSSSRGQETA